jgi:hypothetical protein
VNSAGWANALPAVSSDESARMGGQIAREGQKGGDGRLGERGRHEHADAFEAVGDQPGHRREGDHGHERGGEQGRDREAAAGQGVHLKREHDEGQQVAGGREEDGAGQEAEIA